MSNRIGHASLFIALLAVAASFGHQHSLLFAAHAYDCLSLSEAPEARASVHAAAASIDLAKTAVTRSAFGSKASGDRLTGTNGLLIPPLQWQPALERRTTLLHIHHDRSGHAGRAPPTV